MKKLEELGRNLSIDEREISVRGVNVYPLQGPWKTKADANLRVGFAMPFLGYDLNGMCTLETMLPNGLDAEDFFAIDSNEEEKLREAVQEKHPDFTENISGARFYFQTGLKRRKNLAGEFHRLRREILFPIEGELEAKMQDVYGDERKFVLQQGQGVYVPPFILHSYRTRKSCVLGVFANTMFVFHRPKGDIYVTDTYSPQDFEELKKHYSK